MNFRSRGGGRIDSKQPRTAFRYADGCGHGCRAPLLDVRPQSFIHDIEARDFQRAKLRGLADCCLTERGEFRLDVAMNRVDIDIEFLGDLAVRGSSFPQLERPRAAFGDGFKLSASNAEAAALRVYGVAPARAWSARN